MDNNTVDNDTVVTNKVMAAEVSAATENGVQFNKPIDVANYLGISLKTLYGIVTNQRIYYTKFKIPKASGGFREINAPSPFLKAIERKMMEVYNKFPVSDIAYGYIKGVKPIEAARVHVNRAIVCKVDIHDFFGSTRTAQIKKHIMRYGYDQDTAYVLAVLATLGGAMPQGSPTSPVLSNIVMVDFDKELKAALPDWTISRYVDDIMISTDKLVDPFEAVETVKSLLKKHGYVANEKKTKVMFHSQRQSIFGLVVNRKLNFRVEQYRTLRAMVHNYVKSGNDDMHTYRSLRGKVQYFKQVNPDKAQKLLNELETSKTHRAYAANKAAEAVMSNADSVAECNQVETASAAN